MIPANGTIISTRIAYFQMLAASTKHRLVSGVKVGVANVPKYAARLEPAKHNGAP